MGWQGSEAPATITVTTTATATTAMTGAEACQQIMAQLCKFEGGEAVPQEQQLLAAGSSSSSSSLPMYPYLLICVNMTVSALRSTGAFEDNP